MENQQEISNQSEILSESEVETLLGDTITEADADVVLPSDTVKDDDYSELSKEELIAKLKEKATTPEDTITEVPTNIVDEFTTRFEANEGKFTDKDYAELASKGYSKEFVDTYVSGIQAKEVAYYEELLKPYGSMEDYAEAIVYAQSAWEPKQISAYNKALKTADADTTTLLVSSLMKEFKSSKVTTTNNGPITQTSQPKVIANTGYDTKSDMVKDMNDSRYGKDVSYTNKVEQKLMNTDTNAWYSGISKGV